MGTVRTFKSLAESIASLPRHGIALLVGVDGPGGAGKSTFAGSLAAAFEGLGLPAAVVHMDDFYLPSAQRPAGHEETKPVAGDFDWKRIRDQVLEPLKGGCTARYQRSDWETDALAEWHSLLPDGAAIIEGISALRDELSRFYAYKVWVESPRQTRLERGLARNGESARPVWEQYWMPAEERYFRIHLPQEKADLRVDGSGRPDMDPGLQYIELQGSREGQSD